MQFITKKQITLPKRNGKSHKGQNGSVLAIGGSENYPGAITLAGIAALRSGCDLVRVITPSKVAWAINCHSLDLITIKAKGKNLGISHLPIIMGNSEKADVVLFGNGMDILPSTKKLCVEIAKIKKLEVIDADAIKALCMNSIKNSIITPHAKELEIFLLNSGIDSKTINKIKNERSVEKKSKLIQVVCKYFLENNNVILLKGPVDSIISEDKIYFSKGGNAGMTKGGTGDVLAGLCSGFLAQSKDLVQSAINASYVNKQIGDILYKKKKGFTYLASDMISEIKRIQ